MGCWEGKAQIKYAHDGAIPPGIWFCIFNIGGVDVISTFCGVSYLSWQSSTRTELVDLGCRKAICLLSAPSLGDVFIN